MRTGMKIKNIPDANTFFSNQGNPMHPIYAPVTGPSGELVLDVSGYEDTDVLIQSYAEECDMALILSRLMAGDDSVLYQRVPMYGDFSGCTWNHAEMLQNVLDARTYFDKLPDDVKARFDNSFVQWINSAGSKEWADNMMQNKVAQAVEQAQAAEEKKAE